MLKLPNYGPDVALANARIYHEEGILPATMDLRPGDVCLANDSRFGEAYFNVPLTTFAMNWVDPNNIQDTLQFFAPTVRTGRYFTYKEFINAEEFYSEADDVRAIGADFKRVEFKAVHTTAKTENKGLTVRVDLDEEAQTPGWEEIAVGRLVRRLYRNELRRAITLISNAATNTAKTWDTTAGKDPDMDVITDLLAAVTANGIRPTRVGYGDTAWAKRLLSGRAQVTAGGFQVAATSLDELPGMLNVDKCMVSRERYVSATGTKSEILNNLVFEFIAMDDASVNDPSNIKRFVSPCTDGSDMRVYRQQISAKLVDITVEHYCLTKITSTLGLRKLTIS